ncbi:MAG TPA: lipocalin family protein, partial [Polyangiaceae bacterium]|nr:lipocalin family protein [Polyangiaceae bacterium]
TIPLSCFPASGAAVACTGIQMGGAEDGGTGGVGSCVISNSNCVCTLAVPSTGTESGTYEISGSTLTTTPSGGSGSTTNSYCVSGNTLHLSGTVSGVMGTQQVVATKQ